MADYSQALEEIDNHIQTIDPDIGMIFLDAFPSQAEDRAAKIAQYSGEVNAESGMQDIRVQIMARAKSSGQARALTQRIADAMLTIRGEHRASNTADPVFYSNAYIVQGLSFVKIEDNLNHYSISVELVRQGQDPQPITT